VEIFLFSIGTLFAKPRKKAIILIMLLAYPDSLQRDLADIWYFLMDLRKIPIKSANANPNQ